MPRPSKPIKILQLVNGFAIGGGELKLLELVQQLVKNHKSDFDIVVCSVGQGGPLEAEFRKLGVQVHIYKKKCSFDLSLIFRVAQLVRREKIDIIQTTLFYADVIGAYAAWITGVENVYAWEVTTHPFMKRHLLAYRLAAVKMKAIITVSDAIRKQVISERKISPEKVKTIHYGIDISKTTNADPSRFKRENGFSKNDILVGTVARLTEQKGHRYLIEAARAIVTQHPRVKFVFVGDGPLRDQHESRVKELGLQNHIYFMGFRNDVDRWLSIFNLFVLPSLYEGLPNVVLEAMASGKAIVATAVDGTPEAIFNGVSGILVPARDAEALAASVIKVLTDSNLMKKLGENAKQTARTEFSLQNQIDQFLSVYYQSYSED